MNKKTIIIAGSIFALGVGGWMYYRYYKSKHKRRLRRQNQPESRYENPILSEKLAHLNLTKIENINNEAI